MIPKATIVTNRSASVAPGRSASAVSSRSAAVVSSRSASVLFTPAVLASAASGGSAVPLDIDLTFTLQMLLFAVLIVVLKPLLFDPALKIFEERERRTDGARAEAREMQK